MNYKEEYEKQRQDILDKITAVIIERAFTGNLKFNGNNAVLNKKGETAKNVDIDLLYTTAYAFINKAYFDYNKFKNGTDNNAKQEVVFNIMMITLLSERAERFFNNQSEEYDKLIKQLHKRFEDLRKELDSDFAKVMQFVVQDNNPLNEIFNKTFSIPKLNDEDVIYIIKNYIGEEDFKKDIGWYLDVLYKRRNIMKQLEELGYVDPEIVKEFIRSNDLIEALSDEKSTHILKYLAKSDYFEAFDKGYINAKTLTKYTTIEDLFLYRLQKEYIMKILNKKVFKEDASETIWELYEKGFFNNDEMKEIYQLKYLNPNFIVNKYLEEHKRKIALELKTMQSISDEKIMEFFTASQVLDMANKELTTQETNLFFKNELRSIYNNNNRDLERELIEEKANNDENLLDLYKEGLVSLSKFNSDEVSEDQIIELYKEAQDEDIIIESYNSGLLTQEVVLSLFTEEDKLFELIKNGLNANVLDGYYGTTELCDLYKSKKLELKHIAKLKDSIDIKKINELYISGDLSYSELFEFAEHGVIDYEIATKINDEYDIESKLDELRSRGGISGIDIDIVRPKSKDNKNKRNPVNLPSEETPFSESNIDSDLKALLFENLGAGEEVDVSCKLFKTYVMIPFLDKKLGILEGNGKTYILPIKVILEQVENRGGVDDLIGNAQYKKELSANKKYVRTANHGCNWGINLIRRMEELSPYAVDAQALIEENSDLLKEIRQKYDEKLSERKKHR